MRIILCDDDKQFIQSFSRRLYAALKKYNITPKIVTTYTGINALREFTQNSADVIFLDIDMPEKDGFSVADELFRVENKPLIIFLSSLDHLVYQSFAFQPFWFLRKTCLNDLPLVIEKMLQLSNNQKIFYSIIMNGQNIRIPITDISYFESDGHYIIVHQKEQSLRFKARMSDIENNLNRYFFVRCHVGYLINCRFVKICSRTSVTLTNGKIIPVSRSKADETQNAFMTYMRSLRP